MPSDPRRKLGLPRGDTLLLIVDVQERLAAAMPAAARGAVERNLTVLLRAARRLGLPVVTSEQYRKGLGPTVEAVRALLPGPAIEKMSFSCARSPAVASELGRSGRRTVLVAGMEAHVCVFQSVRDLVADGFTVHVPADAVLSRTDENRRVGLSLCERSGATVTSTETALFDLLGEAGTPEFKELAPLIK